MGLTGWETVGDTRGMHLKSLSFALVASGLLALVGWGV